MTVIGVHAVNRVGQLERGGWYWIKGPASDGLPFPPQAFRVERVHPATLAGREWVEGTLIVNVAGQPLVYERHLIYTSSLDNADTGQHFEKFTRPPATLGPGDYPDIMQQRTAARRG